MHAISDWNESVTRCGRTIPPARPGDRIVPWQPLCRQCYPEVHDRDEQRTRIGDLLCECNGLVRLVRCPICGRWAVETNGTSNPPDNS